MPKQINKLAYLILSVVLLFCFSSCTKEKKQDDNGFYDEGLSRYFDTTLPEGALEFSHSPVATEHFSRIIPLGQINPPAHTFPTDHIYFVMSQPSAPVVAPAGGKVMHIHEPNSFGDSGITIGVTSTISYYLGHIFLDADIKLGDIVASGAALGISGNTACVDFGMFNKNVNNGFLNTKTPSFYADKPLAYYKEPLKGLLYSFVKPHEASDPQFTYNEGVTDGEFMLDKAGTLSGNWFREGCFNEQGWYEWQDTLSFGFDVYYPSQIRIGSGLYGNAFALNNEDNPIRPHDVTVASGIVVYYLYNANNTYKGRPTASRTGIMIIRMLTDSRLMLEILDDTTSAYRDFTPSALYYQR